MRLRSITLHGYKSFASKTSLEFDAPMTAIVGPNGSGKSNVMDALRWAIGAGSGSALRTKRADDVIFTGSRDRAPSGLAEVRIELDNSDSWLELDAAEVEVVRRVHRDGQSEARINGRQGRLRDVQDLFRSSGLGSGGFALMSQGLVDEVLRLRPQERRQAIEEVGGVWQHRHQMEESRRRRLRAQEHLDRACLLRDELGPRVRKLERASKRAVQHRELSAQLEEAQRAYFSAAAAELSRQHSARSETAAQASTAKAAAERRRAELSTRQSEFERELSEARREAESAAQRKRAAESELSSLRHQQELDEQRIDLLRREVESLAESVGAAGPTGEAVDAESARRALAEADERLQVARRERDTRQQSEASDSAAHDRAVAEVAEARRHSEEISRRWEQSGETLSQLEQELPSAEGEVVAAERELESAIEIQRVAERRLAEAREASELAGSQMERLSRRIADVEAQLAALDPDGEPSGTLAALLRERVLAQDGAVDGDVEPHMAQYAALLGELMEARLFEDVDAAAADVARRIVADAGRAVGVVSADAVALLESLLEGVELVANLEAAKLAVSSGRTAVTADGIVVRPDGVVLGGASRPGERRQRQQRADLEAEREDLVSQRRSAEERAAAAGEVEELERAASEAGESVDASRRRVSEAQQALVALQQRQSVVQAQRDGDAREIERLRGQLEESQERATALSERLASAGESVEVDIAALERERDSLAAAAAESGAREAAQQRVLAERQRLDSLTAEVVSVERAIAERKSALEAAEAAVSEAGGLDEAERRASALESRRGEAASELEKAQQARVLSEREDAEASAALREVEASRGRLAAQAASSGVSLEAAEVESRAARQSAQSTHLNGASSNGAGGAPNGAGASSSGSVALAVSAEDEAAEPDVAELERAMEELQAKLARLGPVEPEAAVEFEAEQERWQRLEAQIADLESTEASLRTAERELEALTERKFREAVREVDAAFQRYFELMFRGGRAQLVLTDESAVADDGDSAEVEGGEEAEAVMSAGVEIRAQPPGKRVSALGLLSGGERALTAIALLFALLEVRPAPFCVLDEVDAALDEANVERFVAALKERARETQFIVITHNRRTIEQADRIYGVTMGSSGVSQLLSVRVDEALAASS